MTTVLSKVGIPVTPWRGVDRSVIASTAAWLGLAWIGYNVLIAGSGGDAHAYWAASQTNPYGRAVNESDAYVYSPAFLQAFAPLQLIPWDVFRVAWLASGIATLVWMTGPVVALLLLLPGIYSPVWTDLYFGNIYVFMAAALVLGIRYPAAWAFLVLTKVTPGVAIAWYAVRREWRSLGIAVGVTLAIAAGSFLLAPHLWVAWIALLQASSSPIIGTPPIEVRAVVALGIVALGARRGWTALLPLAVLIAQPVLWYSAFTLLVGWFALLRSRDHDERPPPGEGRGPKMCPMSEGRIAPLSASPCGQGSRVPVNR